MIKLSRIRLFFVLLGGSVALYAASLLWEILAEAMQSGSIMVQSPIRRRPRVPPSPYPWQQAWTILLGWGLFAAAGLAVALGALRGPAWVFLSPVLVLMGFISIAGATVLSSISGAATFAVTWIVGVGAFFGLIAINNRIERWKVVRRTKPLQRNES